MQFRILALLAFAFVVSPLAHANTIFYSFTNNSSFTLGGQAYGPGVTLTLDADTDNLATSGDYFFDTPGSQFITNRFGVGILSSGGLVLATIADPVQFVYDTLSQNAYLIDGATGDLFLSTFIGAYDGATNKHAAGSGVPLSPFDTSAGQFELATTGDVTSFDAVVSPEPAPLLLFATGMLGLIGVAGKRLRKQTAH